MPKVRRNSPSVTACNPTFFDALPILQFLHLQLALDRHKKYRHNYIDDEPVLKPLGVKLPTISKRYGAEVRIVAFGKVYSFCFPIFN